MSYPPDQTSPTRARTGGVANLAPPVSNSISASKFRTEFRIDLLRTVLYNRQDVLRNLLGPGSPESASLITQIAIAVNKDCGEHLTEIKRVSALPTRNEKAMYGPLKEIFRFIEVTRAKHGHAGPRPYFRQAIPKDNEMVKLEDPLFPEALYGKPDFLVADVPPRKPHRDQRWVTDYYSSGQLRWRQCPAFIEVKSSPKDCPVPADYADVKETLVQGADYARMILASRPFHLFAYGLFICGIRFTVGLFDRSGIVLSENMEITRPADLRTFVHIVVRLLWEMSPVDLGLDPTVQLLDGETYYQPDFPRFRVTMGDGTDPADAVETVGPPLWLSYSLLGRGTSIWPALTSSNTPVILKTAWHTPGRQAEAVIYKKITDLLTKAGVPYPRGIAKPSTGGDVILNGAPLSVTALRDSDFPLPANGPITDRILHRVVLKDYGKPLWDWLDVREFGLTLKDVVAGHQKLYESIGVLHRDISAGNILIRVAAEREPDKRHQKPTIHTVQPERENIGGFLTDFELASFKPLSAEGGVEEPIEKKPGDTISGTPLFMATTLLEASLHNLVISRTVEHDLEALCWVIVYAIYKHGLDHTKGSQEHRDLQAEFWGIFSALSVQKLLSQRSTAFGDSQGNQDIDSFYKAVHHLQEYAKKVHTSLLGFLDFIWYLLKKYQPRHDEMADTGSSWRSELLADLPTWRPQGSQLKSKSKSAIELTHECLLTKIDKFLSELD